MHDYANTPNNEKVQRQQEGQATVLQPQPGSKAAGHANMLQLQRTHGNRAVQRMLQRQADVQRDPDADAAAPSKISGPGGTVSTESGVINVDAPMVNINAPLTKISGIVDADVVKANQVIGASYTPGAGNIW